MKGLDRPHRDSPMIVLAVAAISIALGQDLHAQATASSVPPPLPAATQPQAAGSQGGGTGELAAPKRDSGLQRSAIGPDGTYASGQGMTSAQSQPSGPPTTPAPSMPQGLPTQSVTPQSTSPPPAYPMMVPVAPMYYPQSAPSPNYFLPPAMPYGMQPPAMPYAMPYAMPAPYAMPYAMASAVPFAGAPPALGGGLNAVTNQTVSVPTSRSASRVRVRGPGLLGSGIARLGEFMTLAGRTRIQTIQETQLETPLTQPSGGVATISSTASTPLIAPQSMVTNPGPPPAQPQSLPVAPTPSPQSDPHHKCHFWCRHN